MVKYTYNHLVLNYSLVLFVYSISFKKYKSVNGWMDASMVMINTTMEVCVLLAIPSVSDYN